MDVNFSVIIPSFNRADILPEAIESVFSQQYRNFELIIVDDGSTDDTQRVVEPFLEKDDRIHFHKTANTGAADSRNTGVSIARGKYITFLDSDDIASAGWLQCYSEMIDQGAEVGCNAITHVTNHAREIIKPRNLGPAFHNFKMKFTNGGSYFLSREIFNAVNGFDSDVRSGQHTELGIRVAEYCYRNQINIKCVDEPLVTIRHTRKDHIRTNDESVYLGTKYFIQKHRESLQKDKDLLYDHLSVLVYRGVAQPFQEVLDAYMGLWRLKPLSPKTYYRLIKDLLIRRVALQLQKT